MREVLTVFWLRLLPTQHAWQRARGVHQDGTTTREAIPPNVAATLLGHEAPGCLGQRQAKIRPAASSKSLKKDAEKIARAVASRSAQKQPSSGKKKKKKSSFWSSLAKGVGTAASISEAILPLLVAQHGPTKLAATQNSAAFASVPLATGDTMGNLTGVKNLSVVQRDKRGNALTIRLSTVDLVTSVTDAALSAGDVVTKIPITPLASQFIGSKFSENGKLYERFAIRKASLIYEPTCAATTAGAFSACTFDDPLAAPESLGSDELLKVVGSQPGADTWQVWSMGAVDVPGSADWLFTDPNDSDARWSIGGLFVMTAATDIAGGTSPGKLYLAAEVDYSVPSLVDSMSQGDAIFLDEAPAGGNISVHSPFNLPTTNVNTIPGSQFEVAATFSYSGSSVVGNAYSDLPPGDYLGLIGYQMTTGTAGIEWDTTDEADTYGVQVSKPLDWAFIDPNDSAGNGAFIAIPPGIPPGTPLLTFTSGTVTTVTDVQGILVSLNPDVWSGGAPFDATQSRLQQVQARHDLRNAQLMSRTSQGKQRQMDVDLKKLMASLRCPKSSKFPALPPGPYSPLSFSPSAAPATAAGRAAAGEKAGVRK